MSGGGPKSAQASVDLAGDVKRLEKMQFKRGISWRMMTARVVRDGPPVAADNVRRLVAIYIR